MKSMREIFTRVVIRYHNMPFFEAEGAGACVLIGLDPLSSSCSLQTGQRVHLWKEESVIYIFNNWILHKMFTFLLSYETRCCVA